MITSNVKGKTTPARQIPKIKIAINVSERVQKRDDRADNPAGNSRCWISYISEGELRWRYGVPAYTNTKPYGSVYVGKQNFCPGYAPLSRHFNEHPINIDQRFFALPNCPDRLAENMGRFPVGRPDRLDLTHYTCRSKSPTECALRCTDTNPDL
jgi:hypothetical protein